ncbi:tyrosine-type recombinase/integrase [Desulfobacter vibrioformis]|uniref:tyrosine-type recombinase/integrase n=1 Tax=Desulfobacter vibrioformis TaxID=34031 RepID=UPI0005570F06|nr:tyrosine-type recombinase/integrase [Desulfobacter vibrioformis]
MEKGQNFNHPKKGSRIEVEPLRREKDIKAIIQLLSGHPRDHLLFVMGINNGIRVGDLLNIKVGDVRYLKSGQVHQITESKTKKKNVVVINKSVRKALDTYFSNSTSQIENHHYLFRSRKGENFPLSVQAVHGLVKKWTQTINLKGNYGTHTLRKTWGYQQRTKYGVGFDVIAKRFNHSDPKTTMTYLGIEDKEVHSVLMNEIG